MTQSAAVIHATTKDVLAITASKLQIAAELKARAAHADPFSALSIPAAPLSRPVTPPPATTVPKAPSASLPAPQLTQRTEPPPLPVPTISSVAPDPAQIDDLFNTFLRDTLPQIAQSAQPFLVAMQELFAPPFHVGELWSAFRAARTLGDQLSEQVSRIVAVGAPFLKGLDAEATVMAIVSWLLHRALSPYLPDWALAALIPTVLGGVRWIYEAKVRPALKGPRT
jgi:hypothetical protein